MHTEREIAVGEISKDGDLFGKVIVTWPCLSAGGMKPLANPNMSWCWREIDRPFSTSVALQNDVYGTRNATKHPPAATYRIIRADAASVALALLPPVILGQALCNGSRKNPVATRLMSYEDSEKSVARSMEITELVWINPQGLEVAANI